MTQAHINLSIYSMGLRIESYLLYSPPTHVKCELCIIHDSLKLMYHVQKIGSTRFIVYPVFCIEHMAQMTPIRSEAIAVQ